MANILLIDDNVQTTVMRSKVLAVHGHFAQIALDGLTGLRLAEALSPDLIILDHHLPDISGAEVMQRLKAILPDVPVISLSAFPDLPEVYTPPPDAFLVKGDSVQELIRTIELLLPK